MSELWSSEKRKKPWLHPFPEFATETAQQKSPGGSKLVLWELGPVDASVSLAPWPLTHALGPGWLGPELAWHPSPFSSTYWGTLRIHFLPDAEFHPGSRLHYFIFKSKEQMLASKILGNIWNPTQHLPLNSVISSPKYKLSFPKVGRVCVSRWQSAMHALCPVSVSTHTHPPLCPQPWERFASEVYFC